MPINVKDNIHYNVYVLAHTLQQINKKRIPEIFSLLALWKANLFSKINLRSSQTFLTFVR